MKQGSGLITYKDDFMQTIKATYDGVNLIPKQPIPAEGRYEVVVTFVEQIDLDVPDENTTLNTDISFWREFDELAAGSEDEWLSPEDFPRTRFSRELTLFDDKGQTI